MNWLQAAEIFSGNHARLGAAAQHGGISALPYRVVHRAGGLFRHAKGRAGCGLSLKWQGRDRAVGTAYQRKSFGPSFQPANVHKAIVPPYHSAKKGTESSAQ